MQIVPDEDALGVEAVLENRDIGFVQPGQLVTVKVETFPFTRYGTLPGHIVFVSRDAVPDERRDQDGRATGDRVRARAAGADDR